MGMNEICNRTPHDLTFEVIGEGVWAIPAELGEDKKPIAARIRETTSDGGWVGDVGITDVILGEIDDLPSPRPGVAVVVSMPTAKDVALTYPERRDVFYPYVTRRENGNPVAWKLGRIVPAKPEHRLGFLCRLRRLFNS